MILWIDEQLPPRPAAWIEERFSVRATPVRDLGFARAKDKVIFAAAKNADVILVTKDSDFLDLLRSEGPPPRVLWVTLGNTSNRRLQAVLSTTLRDALALSAAGEPLVEVRDSSANRGTGQ